MQDGNGVYIKNLKISGYIKTTGAYAAGLVGWPDGKITIENCVNSCNIEGGSVAGGLIGCAGVNTNIYNSINFGSVLAKQEYAGGIIGVNFRDEVNIINTANLGNLCSETQGEYVGGIIGFYASYWHGTKPFNIENNYSSGKIEGIDRKAGIIGGNWDSQSVYQIENNFWLEGSAIKGIYNFPDNSQTKTKEYMQSQEFVNELNKYIDENPIEGITLLKWKYNEGNYPTFE